MMALDTFSNQFGAAVGYDDSQQAITISLGNQTVSFVPYGTTAWINGTQVALDSPVVIVDGITYLPLDFLCSVYNLGCTWGNNNAQVEIINVYTGQPIIFYTDFGWGARRHVWRYHYNYNDYARFPHVYPGHGYPNHGLPPGGYGQPGHMPPEGMIHPEHGMLPGGYGGVHPFNGGGDFHPYSGGSGVHPYSGGGRRR